MAAPDVDITAATYASAVAISQRRGTGAPRGHRHRRLVALTLANRLALAAWFVVAIAFDPVRLPLLAIAVRLLPSRAANSSARRNSSSGIDTAVFIPEV